VACLQPISEHCQLVESLERVVNGMALWCRLRSATEAALRGASLTEAAHLAEFSDSAHRSRSFRAMYGVVPSLLFKPGQASVTFFESATNI